MGESERVTGTRRQRQVRDKKEWERQKDFYFLLQQIVPLEEKMRCPSHIATQLNNERKGKHFKEDQFLLHGVVKILFM